MRIAALVACVLALAASPAFAARAHVPKSGHTLVLVGQDTQTEDDYVRETGGRVPAGFMNYIFLEDSPAQFSKHLADIQAHADKYPRQRLAVRRDDGLLDVLVDDHRQPATARSPAGHERGLRPADRPPGEVA